MVCSSDFFSVWSFRSMFYYLPFSFRVGFGCSAITSWESLMRTRISLFLSRCVYIAFFSTEGNLFSGNALSVQCQIHMAGFGFAEESHWVCAAGQVGQFVKLCVLLLESQTAHVKCQFRAENVALSRPPSVQCLEGTDPIVSRKSWEDKDRLYV